MSDYQTLITSSIQDLSESDIGDLNYLLSCISTTAAPLERDTLAHILEHSVLVVMRHTDERSTEIHAMGFMGSVISPSGYRMHVSDVCVSPLHRRKGLGRKVVEALLTYARKRNADSVDITSNLDHEAAHSLFHGLGFKVREANVYRFVLHRIYETPA